MCVCVCVCVCFDCLCDSFTIIANVGVIGNPRLLKAEVDVLNPELPVLGIIYLR